MNRTRQFGILVVAALLLAAASISFTLVYASAARPAAKTATLLKPSIQRSVRSMQSPFRALGQLRKLSVRRSPRAFHAALEQLDQTVPLTVMMPLAQECTFQPLASPPQSPAGAGTAVLNPVPSDLSQPAGVEYPPCPRDTSGPFQPTASTISFRIVSVTRYTGSAGTVWITLDTPSAAAVSRGLDLGTPAGSLPDGSPLYVISGATDQPSLYPSTLVQWVHGGSIVTISSSDVSASRLESLADTVSVS